MLVEIGLKYPASMAVPGSSSIGTGTLLYVQYVKILQFAYVFCLFENVLAFLYLKIDLLLLLFFVSHVYFIFHQILPTVFLVKFSIALFTHIYIYIKSA